MTVLVVSDQSIEADLRENLPEEIAGHTEVEYFPYCNGALNRLVAEHPPLQEVLRLLSPSSDASLDELETTLGVLGIAFLKTGGGGRVDELLTHAQTITPHRLRLFPHQVDDVRLTEECQNVLNQISNLKWGLERGYFTWHCGPDSGILPYNCLDKQFGRFQRDVVKARPGTFDELEPFLV